MHQQRYIGRYKILYLNRNHWQSLLWGLVLLVTETGVPKWSFRTYGPSKKLLPTLFVVVLLISVNSKTFVSKRSPYAPICNRELKINTVFFLVVVSILTPLFLGVVFLMRQWGSTLHPTKSNEYINK